MGDQDDRDTGLGGGRNTGLDQEDVMFRRLLGTLEEGQHIQHKQNRRMDMMLQLMARHMGISINIGDANNGNNNNGRNDNNSPKNNINGNNGHGNNGNEVDNFRHIVRPARRSSLRPLLPTFQSRDRVQPVNEPQITKLQV